MFLRDHPAIRPGLDYLVAKDPHFKKILKPADIESIPHTRRPCSYEAFAHTVVGQQLSTKAAATIWARLDAELGGVTPQSVNAAPDETLRAAGLSGQKVTYLRGLSAAVMDQSFVPENLDKLDDAQVIARITALKGFGRWSAEMVLIFALARPDVFSGGDLGLREGLRQVLKLEARPTEKQAVIQAQKWAPHRTAASLLLWRVKARLRLP